MKDIITDSYNYCQWYHEPPEYEKCPYLHMEKHRDCSCRLYYKDLKSGYSSELGKDKFLVHRCNECKVNKGSDSFIEGHPKDIMEFVINDIEKTMEYVPLNELDSLDKYTEWCTLLNKASSKIKIYV